MVPELRHLIAADSGAGGGAIQWFPWAPLLVAGIGLGIVGVAVRNERKAEKKTDEKPDDPTGEVPVVRAPPPPPGGTAGERTPPRPPPKPSGPAPE